VDAPAGLPELLDHVVPVDAGLSVGEVLRLAAPYVLAPIREEEGALATVTSAVGVLAEPTKQGVVALEGRDEALVDRPLDPLARSAQSVEHPDEGDLGVLALVPLLAPGSRVKSPPVATTVTTGALLPTMGTGSPLAFGGGDHRNPTPIDPALSRRVAM